MLTVNEVVRLLKERQLFEEVICDNQRHYTVSATVGETEITNVTYDSRHVKSQALFFCKGLNFNFKYLQDAVATGATVTITERSQVDDILKTQLPVIVIIVTDVQKAMATVARAFYGNPDQVLTMIGFTGTQGKTTSVYFTRHILQAAFGKQVGQLSSIDECLDGEHFIEAHLTTPESLDLFRMLKEAVDNGMKYLVMEVSSQAYKKSRVYGLEFDYGVFLNISPDHISPVEHPDFDDYLYCKSQIVANSKTVIISREIKDYAFLAEKAAAYQTKLISFGEAETADYQYQGHPHGQFTVKTATGDTDYQIKIPGDFNYANATAAIAVAQQLAADQDQIKTGLLSTTVPGRMECLTNDHGYVAYVDYAHNYLSLSESFKFMKHEYPNGRLIVVIGAAGGKAESRRHDIGMTLSEYADVAILTSEDNFKEDPYQIVGDIQANITNPELQVVVEVDRVKAIEKAFSMVEPGDVIFMAGKGREVFMHDVDGDKPYIGDYQLLQKLMAEYDR